LLGCTRPFPPDMGFAWLRAACTSPIRAGDVRLRFQEVLTAIEFVVPAVIFGLAKTEEDAELPSAG
jgi:hypothetical protein